VSLVYFRKFHYTSVLVTAGIFAGFVFVPYTFVINIVLEKTQGIFNGLFGMWIPIFLIFFITILIGEKVKWRILSEEY